MDAPSTDRARDPLLWMDISTSLRGRNSHATGTLRVERKLAAALSEAFGARLRFCRFDPLRQRFTPAELPPPPQAAAAPSRGPGARDARSASLGKRIERSVRKWIRAKVASQYRSRQAGAVFSDAAPGDVLFLGGETWGERNDFDTLTRLRRERGIRLAAICQDVIPLTHPQFFESEAFVARYRAYIEFLIREADLLIAISQSVAAELRRIANDVGGFGGRLEVVVPGSDVDAKAAPQAPQTLPPLSVGDFVITVSTIQSRKNIDLLYRLWRRFAEEGRDVPRLVVVGQRGFGSADLLWQIENDPLVKDRILLLHRVSDAELEWLYRNCRFTLYPSIAEGWGLPVSESLAHGKLCIASNTTSIPEAGAGLALHLDPFDVKAWRDTIARLAENPAEIEAAEQNIKNSYRPRSWAESASELAEHLRGLLAGRKV